MGIDQRIEQERDGREDNEQEDTADPRMPEIAQDHDAQQTQATEAEAGQQMHGRTFSYSCGGVPQVYAAGKNDQVSRNGSVFANQKQCLPHRLTSDNVEGKTERRRDKKKPHSRRHRSNVT
ncbi:hypothetical protein RE428_33830 [Marinobacter nanhaiticus D15-8W]|nr:hypothetical protein RE428_33830 [Marinobacter nanhaiticus D15-8W]